MARPAGIISARPSARHLPRAGEINAHQFCLSGEPRPTGGYPPPPSTAIKADGTTALCSARTTRWASGPPVVLLSPSVCACCFLLADVVDTILSPPSLSVLAIVPSGDVRRRHPKPPPCPRAASPPPHRRAASPPPAHAPPHRRRAHSPCPRAASPSRRLTAARPRAAVRASGVLASGT
eukprot:XP_020400247.1 mediator of RNA polymerase II transcription subunit 25-like [Zea mays]